MNHFKLFTTVRSIDLLNKNKIFSAILVFVVFLHFVSCGKNDSPTSPNDGDGKVSVNKIAFNNIKDGLGRDYALAVIEPDGSNLVLIGAGMDTEDFLWTPDGRLIFEYDDSPGEDFYIVDADGTNLSRINVNGSISLVSPDGKLICYTRSGRMFIADMDGSNERSLAPTEGSTSPCDWSPDGTKILFLSFPSEEWWKRRVVKTVDLQTGMLTKIADYNINENYSNAGAEYLPDGSRILVHQYRIMQPHKDWIVAVDLNGNNQKRIIEYEDLRSTEPSPNSKKILFWRGGSMVNWDLYTINSDGTGEQLIAQNANNWEYAEASWSPDSKQIVFTAKSSLDIVDADGSNRRKLIDFNTRYTEPIWSMK